MSNRAIDMLRYKQVDRFPAVHFGYWEELIVEWYEQGHIGKEFVGHVYDSSPMDRKLDKMLGWDFNWSHTHGGNMGLYPSFTHQILEVLPNGFRRERDGNGVTIMVKDGAEGIPSSVDYLLKDRETFDQYFRDKMQYTPKRVKKLLLVLGNLIKSDKRPVGVSAGSVLGSIRDMLTLEGMSYMLYDDYELMDEIISTYADMQYRTLEAVLKTGAKFDFAHYWEDICFNKGPLLSPKMFEDLCAKHYDKRNKLLASYGIDLISLDCDGVVDSLLPVWLETGVNVMFPIEVGTWGDQFAAARAKYGKRLLGVGGMDKHALRQDRAAVDREIERLKPLIELGGFVPCPDHRLMPGTKWELVQYYTDRIKNLKL